MGKDGLINKSHWEKYFTLWGKKNLKLEELFKKIPEILMIS